MNQNEPYTINGVIRETVQGYNLFLPGLDELIGSSIRENDYTKLTNELAQRNMGLLKSNGIVIYAKMHHFLMEVMEWDSIG